MVDKVAIPSLESSKSQKMLGRSSVPGLLSDPAVQKTNVLWQWGVIVSRVVTQYLPAFKVHRRNMISHIPKLVKCSEEMAKTSKTVIHI